MTKLPVRQTAREAYRYVRTHGRLLAIPALLLIAADTGIDYLAFQGFKHVSPFSELLPMLQVLALVVDSAFAVGLYRSVIGGEEHTGPAFFRWDRHLFSYAVTAFKVSFALVALLFVLLWLFHGYLAELKSHPGWQAALLAALALPLFYLGLRLIMAFPAAAMGHERRFRLSWRIMSGNILRFVALQLLVLIPLLAGVLVVAIPILVLIGLAHLAVGHDTSLPIAASDAAVETAATILMTVAVSLSYRILVPPDPQVP